MNRLFIIGNGFDLDHYLPTKFNPDFKNIAESIEQNPEFWDMYQTQEANIWSDFENCLAIPDFNSLEEIFEGYAPDYYSDYERDRNAIITQVDLNGVLEDELCEFAYQAERALNEADAKEKYVRLFDKKDLFINFNYTHTLEKLYHINKNNVLHVHGEVGMDNLLLGYPEGEYCPEKYIYDVRQKGRGPYREVQIDEYIEEMLEEEMMDIYTYLAYKQLIEKTEGFKKAPQIHLVEEFLGNINIDKIIVIGHSCSVDMPYFDYLHKKYLNSRWVFKAFSEKTEKRIKELTEKVGIENYQIITKGGLTI